MSETIEVTIKESERAELEALLDLCLAEFDQARGEHERLMAQVDQNIRESKRQLALVRSRLKTPCGKS
ncbi:MAG: hypothetical protein HY314_11765 [Acidobacteria bacterium]|nr:hypothetical protein [Acidobacteriota bacterium]